MTDRPRLRPIDSIPEGLRGTQRYFWHIHQVMQFPAEEQRIVPLQVREKIEQVFAAQAGDVIEPLNAMSRFLSHPFVFDNLDPAARETLRNQMAETDPAGHAWYQSHMLRINNITVLLEQVRKLNDVAQPTLRRVLDSPPLADRLDEMAGSINFRWKKVTRSLENMTLAEHHLLQRDMLETHIAPLLQDVFDITVLSLNGWQPVPTTPVGSVSRTMLEILDMRAALLRGAQGRKDDKPTGRTD